jgi:hypothetical protein
MPVSTKRSSETRVVIEYSLSKRRVDGLMGDWNDRDGRSGACQMPEPGAGFGLASPLDAQTSSAVRELGVGRSQLVAAPPDQV